MLVITQLLGHVITPAVHTMFVFGLVWTKELLRHVDGNYMGLGSIMEQNV
jgi:hypothetical protein